MLLKRFARPRNLLVVPICVLCLSISVSCRDDRQQGAGGSTGPVLSASSPRGKRAVEFATAGNRLGVELYRELGKTQRGNIAVAPSSISLALAMTWTGALGKTRDQMSRTLHLRGTGREVATSARGLLSWLDAVNGESMTLRLASGLFVQQDYELESAFLEVTEQFGAPVVSVPFEKAPGRARKTINLRVAEQTRQHIREILPERSLNERTRLVLTNAVYFLGYWVSPFGKSSPHDFHTSAEATKNVPMMYRASDFPYAAADGVQVLELPYKGNELSMLVVLPVEKQGLSKLEETLTVARVKAWAKGLKKTRVEVILPKFKLHSTTELKQSLIALGMTLAFDPFKADFGGMSTSGKLFLGGAYHQVVVQVDEKGTVAAAASAAKMQEVSEPPNQIWFVADHPFLFAIRHRASGALVFLGRVVDPSS